MAPALFVRNAGSSWHHGDSLGFAAVQKKQKKRDEVTTMDSHVKRDTELNAPQKNRKTRSDDGNAFIPDPNGGAAHTNVDLAEEMGEDFIAGATSNDDAASNDREEVFEEEMGGPFLEESASGQFATGTDEANPDSATREPFPTAMRVPE